MIKMDGRCFKAPKYKRLIGYHESEDDIMEREMQEAIDDLEDE